MVSDDMITALVKQMQQQSQRQLLAMQITPAPQLRLNSLGQLEVTERERDTHDEWRRLNEAPE